MKCSTPLGNKSLCLYCFLVLVFFVCDQLIRAQEVDNENEFSYDEEDPLGPANWGQIRPEWSLCGNGTMQSPIDLEKERVEVDPKLGKLRRFYKSSNATLINRGHDIMLRWDDNAGYVYINGTIYHLKQCHWHSPSEHAIDGKRYDLEIHLVHEASDGKIAAVGIIYEIGNRRDSFLSTLEDGLRALGSSTDSDKVVAGNIDPKEIEFGTRKYYRYMGSLTTPPCTENVIWTIIDKVRTVTRDQVNLLRDAVHDSSAGNARPIQPLNNRPIELYRPYKARDED